MPDLSRKTVLFHDLSGSFTHIAEAVVSQFGRTLYYSFYESALPSVRDYLPGVGLEGIERVTDFDDALERADLVVFTDVGRAGLQKRLREQGVAVWGAGLGSRLEQDRVALKTVLKECGLPVANWTLVRGLDALRDVLAAKDDLYVKFSMFRSTLETYHHLSFFASQTWLDELGVKLGPWRDDAEFIVEEPIEGHAVEVGIDGFLVDGELLTPTLWGYEHKDLCYVGTTAEVPARLLDVQEHLSGVLQAVEYRGAFSIEVRVTEEADYLIDFTARFPSPPSEAQTVLITNLADIMWEGAHGRSIPPEYAAPYCAQLVLRSAWGREHAVGLEVGRPEHVRIHGHCRLNGTDYAVSPVQIEEFAGAVGLGNSVEDAIADAFDAAESVRGYQVQYDVGAFDKVLQCIQDGESLDLPWGRMVGKEQAA
jgi:hypothetical protein